MTSPRSKVNVPAMVFADLKVVNPEDFENSGNLGDVYDKESGASENVHRFPAGRQGEK